MGLVGPEFVLKERSVLFRGRESLENVLLALSSPRLDSLNVNCVQQVHFAITRSKNSHIFVHLDTLAISRAEPLQQDLVLLGLTAQVRWQVIPVGPPCRRIIVPDYAKQRLTVFGASLRISLIQIMCRQHNNVVVVTSVLQEVQLQKVKESVVRASFVLQIPLR